jgi:hypothetical protein
VYLTVGAVMVMSFADAARAGGAAPPRGAQTLAEISLYHLFNQSGFAELIDLCSVRLPATRE